MIKKNDRYILYFFMRAFVLAVTCFIVCIGVLVFVYFGDRIINLNGDKSPIFSGYIIVSPSMVPTINVNDGIIVGRVDNDGYRIGDIISFSSNDMMYKDLTVTHRIVDKESIKRGDSVYTTKGDNNMVADASKVDTKEIYGRVLFIVPRIGYVYEFFSKPSNFFMIIMIGIGGVICYNIASIGRIMVKKRRT